METGAYPGVSGSRQGPSLGRYRHTFRVINQLLCFWTVGGNGSTLRKPTPTRGEHLTVGRQHQPLHRPEIYQCNSYKSTLIKVLNLELILIESYLCVNNFTGLQADWSVAPTPDFLANPTIMSTTDFIQIYY